jgi:hypothetical protein
VTVPEPVDGVQVDRDLWAAWLIERHSLMVQAWVLNLAEPMSTSGCACPVCAPHEQTGPLS